MNESEMKMARPKGRGNNIQISAGGEGVSFHCDFSHELLRKGRGQKTASHIHV